MKKELSASLGAAIIRPFRIGDYDAVVALWRRTEGVGLNESDTRSAMAAYLRRNPRLSFVAEKDGRIISAVLCGHDGRRGYLHHLAVAKRHLVVAASACNWWTLVWKDSARRASAGATSPSSRTTRTE